ncbi:helix-turn-helix domain-containing protein [uncultured Maribacter sp.]
MSSKKRQKLTLKKRVIIEILLKQNKSQSDIAKTLSRAKPTIYRELKKKL